MYFNFTLKFLRFSNEKRKLMRMYYYKIYVIYLKKIIIQLFVRVEQITFFEIFVVGKNGLDGTHIKYNNIDNPWRRMLLKARKKFFDRFFFPFSWSCTKKEHAVSRTDICTTLKSNKDSLCFIHSRLCRRLQVTSLLQPCSKQK